MTYSYHRVGGSGDIRVSDNHRWFVGIIVVLATLAIGYLAIGELKAGPTYGASSTVKLMLEKGHGSGVHIGDGLVLSAAHVAGEGDAVTLKLDDGTTRAAEVIWASTASDIVLLRTSPDGLSASPLSCAPVQVGQAITARGNPLALEFITTHGHIVGVGAPLEKWANVAPVDMVVLPGMSGGGVFNAGGEVIGIAVAVLTAPLGFGASYTGIGVIVPASHVCSLLGRS